MPSLVEEKVDQLRSRAQREIDGGRIPSCQLALAMDGEVVVSETLGEGTDDSRYVIFSATKAVVASAAWVLIQDGELDVERVVAHYIPEFAENCKEAVTVEQVMLHTSGFPRAPLGPPDWFDREARLAKFVRWRLNWEPGTRFEYHPTSAHWVLAELIERLGGEDYRTFIRERVLDPHGLTGLRVGVPPGEQGDIAPLEERGEEASAEEIEAVFGVSELPVTEVTSDAMLGFNEPDVRALGVPGGGAVSDATSLALFYQALLHNPKGVWSDALLDDVRYRVRNTFPDPLLGHPVQRTLGLCTAGDDGKAHFRGFGRTVSPRAFGHNGAAGQLAWADPDTGLSFAFLTNGMDRHRVHEGRRSVALASIAGDCAVA